MRVLQVGELAALIRAALEEEPGLQDTYVEAELGDVHHSAAGHWYFSLKDCRAERREAAVIRAAMFRREAQGLRFQPETGMRVIAHGSVSLYSGQGTLQLYLDSLEPQGVGALALAFQQLVQRLQAEGLFAPERKRRLPFLPRRLAVVTSRQGAAVRDVIHVVQRRCPITEVLVVPSLVQGEGAVPALLAALELAGRAEVDVVLLVRGGGSLEDLQAFNSEALARAVLACPHPVVTGVGHETDTSVVDFVADLRAPTPSVAAELAVPDLRALRRGLAERSDRVLRWGQARLDRERAGLAQARRRLGRLAPARRLRADRQDLDRRQARLDRSARQLLAGRGRELGARTHLLRARGPVPRLLHARGELGGRVGRLEALSPLAVLSRGYSITFDARGRVLRRAQEAAPGDELSTRLGWGRLRSRVTLVESAPEEDEHGS